MAGQIDEGTALYFGPTKTGQESRHPFTLASGRRRFTRLRVASAFATESGVTQITNLLGADAFGDAQKEWLIGLQNGFTQPVALQRLLDLPNSAVRLVDIHEVLANPRLAGSTFFHPKVYELADITGNKTTIISTSANLTEGGLRNNVEQFVSWEGLLTADFPQTLTRWWGKYWKPEWAATPELIDEYARRRPAMQQRAGAGTGGGIVEVEPAPSELRVAPEMWVEAVRPLEGGSRNQLELLLNAHVFFFPESDDIPRDRPQSVVFVDDAGNEYSNPQRQVLFNGPPLRDKGNSMWRVYLPTATRAF
ncbi:MAG: phospholipase D family protein [Acidimicrobiales bacterium]|jgi:HKD family nuclease